MPIERILATASAPKAQPKQNTTIIDREKVKGCEPTISPSPVRLEPPYIALSSDAPTLKVESVAPYVTLEVPIEENVVCFSVWRPGNFELNWLNAERFIKSLRRVEHPVTFEISGNTSKISISFKCHDSDAQLLRAAFQGEYDDCILRDSTRVPNSLDPKLQWAQGAFREFYPPLPYCDLFTMPQRLKKSPLLSFVYVLSSLPRSLLGIYQVVFAPVSLDHDWHGNITYLCDYFYRDQLFEGMEAYFRTAQQNPSSDLRGTALEIDSKADNDSPILAAVPRVAVVPRSPDAKLPDIRGLSSFTSLIQHGGKPLEFVDESDFRQKITNDQIREMFILGRSHRAGAIMNSRELAAWVNLPSIEGSDHRVVTDTLEVNSGWRPDIENGTLIGYARDADEKYPIRVSFRERLRHDHVFGVPGQGKSMLLDGMVLQDINQGIGIGLIDPHGDLAQMVLGQIPEHRIDDVIFFKPSDEEWILKWNLLESVSRTNACHAPDNIVAALRDVSLGWGDRLDTLLRASIAGLMTVEGTNLYDVYTVLKDPAHPPKQVVNLVRSRATSPHIADFWKSELTTYKKEEARPATNKISKLLGSDSLYWMFSQPDNVVDFREIMDERKLFIVDLSGLGPDSRVTIGSVIARLIFLAATSGRNEERVPFHLYLDEAHSFSIGPVKDILEEARKFGVGLVLAHQYLSQFESEDVDALATCGRNIMFKCLKKDSDRIERLIGGEGISDEAVKLKTRDALVHIENEWVKIRTPDVSREPNAEVRRRVIERSREKYCVHKDKLTRGSGFSIPAEMPPSLKGEMEDDYKFDRLFESKDSDAQT